MKVPGAHGRHVETPKGPRHSGERSDLFPGARERHPKTILLCTTREMGAEKENSCKGIGREASQ